MRSLFVLLLALLVCSCAGGSGSGSASPGFAGKPRSFNGDWSGPGLARTEHWTQNHLRFTFHVSKTPEGADVHYNIYEPDGSLFAMGRLVDHYANGNILYSYRRKEPAGSIGAEGFSLEDDETAHLVLQLKPDGRLRLTGHLKYGATRVDIEAALSN